MPATTTFVSKTTSQISANTSSSVKTPLALARGTATRRDSVAASCQSLRWIAIRTYSLVVRPLSVAARAISRLVRGGRLTVRVFACCKHKSYTRANQASGSCVGIGAVDSPCRAMGRPACSAAISLFWSTNTPKSLLFSGILDSKRRGTAWRGSVERSPPSADPRPSTPERSRTVA